MMDKGAMTTQTPRFRGWRCKWCRNLEDEEEKKGLVGHPGTRQGGECRGLAGFWGGEGGSGQQEGRVRDQTYSRVVEGCDCR